MVFVKNKLSIFLLTIVCGIVLIVCLSCENSNIASSDIFLEEKLSESNVELLFYNPNTLDNEGIGIMINKNSDKLSNSATSISSDEAITWGISGVLCKGDCQSFDVLYGVASHEVKKINVVLNGENYTPKLLQNKSPYLIWYIVVRNISSIGAIKGTSSTGEIIYEYPVK